ncbi:CDP-glycerol glycerophosphotransferase family protein [Halobellus sp. Atlit-38R]|uniref:CDP-glycerol glycerophosphotransferase family protein n=1 Tax=Halobellus sp. Atlit-38R TaxID=2282131 RepID=UPI001313E1BE|nr:CDP-glycerol glycerophosphotransferase family protein [Halobellus sp. Atlit-38R]
MSILSLVRNKNSLWVFGARASQSFSGNSKYLYIYCQNHPDIRPVWITKSEEVVNKLNIEGVEVYHAHSLKGAMICARAEYVFITHTVKDVNMFSVIFSKVVQLTHGVPIKRIGWDRNRSRKSQLLKLIRDYIWGDYHCVFVSSEKVIDCFASAYHCSSEKIVPSGYPRNDVLRDPDVFSHPLVKEEFPLPFDPNEKIIAYLPTYRAFNTTPFYEKIDFKKVNAILEGTQYNLLIKPHPGTSPPVIEGYENVYQTNESIDIYPHLHRFQALITDYSSIALDYAVQNRPILHFIYDVEEYRQNRGFYFELEEIFPGDSTTSPEGLTKWTQEITKSKCIDDRQRYHSEFVRQEGLACESIINQLQKSNR